MAIPPKEERWWHPSILIGFVVAYVYVLGLLAGLLTVKLARIAIGRD